MKRMKKILALGLAVVLTFGISMTAWADEPGGGESGGTPAPAYNADGKIGTKDDAAVITIKGVTAENKKDDTGADTDNDALTVTAYRIIEAVYDDDGIYSGYKIGGDYIAAVREIFNASGNADFEIGEDGKLKYKKTVDPANAVKEFPINEAILNAIIKVNNVKKLSGIGMDKGSVDANGICSYSKELPIGSYLIMITGAETKIYSAVVASSYYTAADGGSNEFAGSIGDTSLDLADYKIAKTDAWVKVSDSPDVGKKVVSDDGSKTDHNDVNIGDTVSYEIEVNPIPYYGGDNPTFNIVDTLTGGLVYTGYPKVEIVSKDGGKTDLNQPENDKTVYMLNGKKIATFTWQNGEGEALSDMNSAEKFVVDFVDVTIEGDKTTSEYSLNDYQGQKLVITYTAKVTKDAAVNHNDNSNDAKLNYSKDSKVDGSDGEKGGKTYTYTFAIGGTVDGKENSESTGTGGVITKLGEDEKEDPDTHEKTYALEGAEFTLYTAATKNADGTYTVNPDSQYKNYIDKGNEEEFFDGTATSDARGHLEMRGLKAGTYYLKETKAPDGYSVNEHVFEVVIDAKYYGDEGFTADDTSEDKKTGMLAQWTITIDGELTGKFTSLNEKGGYSTGEGSGNIINTVEIQNTRLISLPSTGGIGTTIFTVAGVVLMIGAAFLFFVNRRKSQGGQEK